MRDMQTKLTSKVLIDTNILIRALVDKNDMLLDLIENTDETHIPLPVFFEAIFVLEKFYKQSRTTIVDYVSTIISYDNVVTDFEALKNSLGIYISKHSLSIVDCFLLVYSKKHKIELKTLDKTLAKAAA
jgi:predicted nucleic acid-binding protein